MHRMDVNALDRPCSVHSRTRPKHTIMALTRTEQETVRTLQSFIAAHGHAPTIRELADELGLSSPSSAHARLRSLETARVIERGDGRARIVRLLNTDAREG